MGKQVYKVYKLVHPTTSDVFYIGRTTQTLKERFNLHLSAAKKPKLNVSKYINELISQGLTPKIELIQHTTSPITEHRYIDKYLPTGLLKNTWHRNWELKGKKSLA